MIWLTSSTRDYQSGVQFSGMDWWCCFLDGTAALPRLMIRGTLMERFLARKSQRLVTMFCSLDWGCCRRVLPSGCLFFGCAIQFLWHRIRRTCLNSDASTPINRTIGFLYLHRLTIICGLRRPRHFDFYWSSRWFRYYRVSNNYDMFLVALWWLSGWSDFHIRGFSHTDVILCKRLRNNNNSFSPKSSCNSKFYVGIQYKINFNVSLSLSNITVIICYSELTALICTDNLFSFSRKFYRFVRGNLINAP